MPKRSRLVLMALAASAVALPAAVTAHPVVHRSEGSSHSSGVLVATNPQATLALGWRRRAAVSPALEPPPGITGVATVPGPGPALATGPSGTTEGSWHSIFDDEFNGNGLDRSDWSTGWLDKPLSGPIGGDELECYARSHVVEGGGELDLNLTATRETCPSGNGPLVEPYTSAMVTTTKKFSFTYGFIQARVWLPGTAAVTDWPAVWADGDAVGSWPKGGEIDVVEGLGGSPCWHFHGPSGAPGGCPTGTFTGGWHTFGADWEPGSVTWYYDGASVGSVTSGVTDTPMFVLMNLAVDHTYGGAIQAPATMRIDYVRVWQH